MVSVRIIFLGFTFFLSFIFSRCDDSIDARSLESAIKTQEEKELIEALQEVLEKLKNKQMPNSGKKFGRLPSCDAGEQCAVRKGARVGKLCGCPQGTACDFFIMKCL
ncbi:cocaine- and amphetamine-regulated transcript protein-like [Chanos chanos]|uniref:Cocaine- and amphetamine-regulated transcript protein-like n=1 Tax=Chanos chanos TaxID=29144 RepID=A0A6J2VIN5_CHACN|nr:cocaine- and amphetamine-regulated transcript protein-like [Chanos chanos]